MIERIKKAFDDDLYLRSHSRALYRLWAQTLDEIRHAFPQFFTFGYPVRTFFRSIGIIISATCRTLLGRSFYPSYGFTGEDRIIESLLNLKLRQVGFYVDVGCSHPVYFSNTYMLYKKGWRGICIDANSEMIQKYSFYRPKDIAVAKLISSDVRERNFYLLTNNVLSTTETRFLEDYRAAGQAIQSRKMTTDTLSNTLATNGAPRMFDLLTIDAEDHDFEVLKSIDLATYSPRLIVLENEDIDLLHPLKDQILQYLLQRGYIFSGYVLKNMYFLNAGDKGGVQ